MLAGVLRSRRTGPHAATAPFPARHASGAARDSIAASRSALRPAEPDSRGGVPTTLRLPGDEGVSRRPR